MYSSYIIRTINKVETSAFQPDHEYEGLSNSLTATISYWANQNEGLLNKFRNFASRFPGFSLGNYIQNTFWGTGRIAKIPTALYNTQYTSDCNILFALILVTGSSCVNWEEVATDVLTE